MLLTESTASCAQTESLQEHAHKSGKEEGSLLIETIHRPVQSWELKELKLSFKIALSELETDENKTFNVSRGNLHVLLRSFFGSYRYDCWKRLVYKVRREWDKTHVWLTYCVHE